MHHRNLKVRAKHALYRLQAKLEVQNEDSSMPSSGDSYGEQYAKSAIASSTRVAKMPESYDTRIIRSAEAGNERFDDDDADFTLLSHDLHRKSYCTVRSRQLNAEELLRNRPRQRAILNGDSSMKRRRNLRIRAFEKSRASRQTKIADPSTIHEVEGWAWRSSEHVSTIGAESYASQNEDIGAMIKASSQDSSHETEVKLSHSGKLGEDAMMSKVSTRLTGKKIEEILESYKDFGQGDHADIREEIVSQVDQLDPSDATCILASLFEEAQKTKAIFDQIRELSLVQNANIAAHKCCILACEHLNAKFATLVRPKDLQHKHDKLKPDEDDKAVKKNDRNGIQNSVSGTETETHQLLIPLPAGNGSQNDQYHKWSIFLDCESDNDIPNKAAIQRVQAAAAVVTNLERKLSSNKRTSCYISSNELNAQRHAAILLSLKSDLLACIDEESMFKVVRDFGTSVLGFNSCHLFLASHPKQSTSTDSSMTGSQGIRLHTRLVAQSGQRGTSQVIAGHVRPPIHLRSKEIAMNQHFVDGRGGDERFKSHTSENFWVRGGEITCYVRNVDETLGQEFPTIEKFNNGLPIAAIKAGEHTAIEVQDSLNMNKIPVSNPAWALSPRLAATLDGSLSSKRASAIAIALAGCKGVVRVASTTQETCMSRKKSVEANYKSTHLNPGTKKSFRCLDEEDLSAAHLLVKALDDTLPVVLSAQRYAESVSAQAGKIRTKLSSLGDMRRHHKKMIEALVYMKGAKSLSNLAQRVISTCISTIESLFQHHLPPKFCTGGTVYSVRKQLSAVDSNQSEYSIDDILDGERKYGLGIRNQKWLRQVAEQCIRLQKTVMYSSVGSSSFPAVVCYPMGKFEDATPICYSVCIFVGDGSMFDERSRETNIEFGVLNDEFRSHTNTTTGRDSNHINEAQACLPTSSGTFSFQIQGLQEFLNNINAFASNRFKHLNHDKGLAQRLRRLSQMRAKTLKSLTKSLNRRSNHNLQHFDGTFDNKPGYNIHLQELCKFIQVQIRADHIQIYKAIHDFAPETALIAQHPIMAMDHVRIPRRSAFVASINAAKSHKQNVRNGNFSAEYLAPTSILGTHASPADNDNLEDADIPRIWILAERFMGGDTFSEPFNSDECSQLVHLVDHVLSTLINFLKLDLFHDEVKFGKSALEGAACVIAGIKYAPSLIPNWHGQSSILPLLKIQVVSMREALSVDSIAILSVGDRDADSSSGVGEWSSALSGGIDHIAHQSNSKQQHSIVANESTMNNAAIADNIGTGNCDNLKRKSTIRAHREMLQRVELTSIVDTLTAGFKKNKSPITGIWDDFIELRPLLKTDSVVSMRNQVYVFERTQPVDEFYNSKSLLEDWLRDHVQRVYICPLISSTNEKLLGLMLLIETVNSPTPRQYIPWFQVMSGSGSLSDETIISAPGRFSATQGRSWRRALLQMHQNATLLMEQAEMRDKIFTH